jgi:hypothetical protein
LEILVLPRSLSNDQGELPSEKEAKMIDAMLVSSIDHGVTPPLASLHEPSHPLELH